MLAISIILIWLCAFALLPLSAAYHIPKDLPFQRLSSPQNSQSTPSPSPVAIAKNSVIIPRYESDYVFDEASFNTTSVSACQDAIHKLKTIKNSSGIAACFNVAFLDEDTNVFGADIKLYYFSEAKDAFNGTRWEDYDLKLRSRLLDFSGLRLTFQTPTINLTANTPQLVMDWRFSGTINELIQLKKLTADDQRLLFTPTLIITTNSSDSTGNTLQTNISPDTLSFTAGYLANDNHDPVSITTPEAIERLRYIIFESSKYEIPGTDLGIFPMGLVVTGAWAGLFIVIICYGILERSQYRSFHQQRLEYASSIRGYGDRPVS